MVYDCVVLDGVVEVDVEPRSADGVLEHGSSLSVPVSSCLTERSRCRGSDRVREPTQIDGYQAAIACPICSRGVLLDEVDPRHRHLGLIRPVRQNSRCGPVRIEPGSALTNSFGTSVCASHSP